MFYLLIAYVVAVFIAALVLHQTHPQPSPDCDPDNVDFWDDEDVFDTPIEQCRGVSHITRTEADKRRAILNAMETVAFKEWLESKGLPF